METPQRWLVVLAIAATMVAMPALAKGYPGEKDYGKQATISLKQAERIALRTFPGKILSKELEKERGGSGLRYSFDIRRGKTVHEVGVDAKTGKVLENTVDSDSD